MVILLASHRDRLEPVSNQSPTRVSRLIPCSSCLMVDVTVWRIWDIWKWSSFQSCGNEPSSRCLLPRGQGFWGGFVNVWHNIYVKGSKAVSGWYRIWQVWDYFKSVTDWKTILIPQDYWFSAGLQTELATHNHRMTLWTVMLAVSSYLPTVPNLSISVSVRG